MTHHHYKIALVLTLLSTQTFAQTALNIGIKAGLLRANEVVHSKNVSTYDRGSYEDEANSSVSLAFSLPLKKKFRLGAEFGLISFRTFLDYNFTYENNATQVINGRYRINQAFVALVPEYRIFDWVYINGGVGLYSDFNSYFTNGTRTTNGISENITGDEYKRHSPFGYLIGIGICPNITKELAFLGEVRFTGSPANIDNPYQIAIGYKAFNFNIGIMYKPSL